MIFPNSKSVSVSCSSHENGISWKSSSFSSQMLPFETTFILCSVFRLLPVLLRWKWRTALWSWRPTARWLGLYMLWNDRRGKVKGAPTSRNALCALLTAPQGTLVCIPGLRFNTLMNFTVLLRIFLSDSGVKKKNNNCQWRIKKLLESSGPNVLLCTEVMPFFCIQCKCQHSDKGNTLVLLRK